MYIYLLMCTSQSANICFHIVLSHTTMAAQSASVFVECCCREELVAKRAQSKGLCNKATFLDTQQEIQDVAHRLKESNKSLCRNII